MSKDRFDELVEKRQSLREELADVESELREIVLTFGTGTTATVPVRTTPVTRKPYATRASRRVAPVADETADAVENETQATQGTEGERQPSLKEVVLEILTQNQRGMELKEVVAEVARMIQSGEYTTKSRKVSPIVSQALFTLKQERLVVVEKSPANNRHLYSLNQTAA